MLDPKHKSSYQMHMNKLSLAKRTQILAMLCEGSSMRSISRIADVSINTVSKLLVEAGEACLAIHDEYVRGVKPERVQCDEIWSFCYAKAKNVEAAKAAPDGAGDVWTWTALDPDSKLMVSYFVGDRSTESAMIIMEDLRRRVSGRIQLTTDGHAPYVDAVWWKFEGDVDFAQVIKVYGKDKPVSAEARYSPPPCVGMRKRRVEGDPNPKHVSTSHVERMNLSIRMQNRRFTRLTNAFSKKLDNHIHALALYFAFYNFCRIHKSLRVTPAMAAGITDRLWTLEDIVDQIDSMAPAPKARGPYKKRA